MWTHHGLLFKLLASYLLSCILGAVGVLAVGVFGQCVVGLLFFWLSALAFLEFIQYATFSKD